MRLDKIQALSTMSLQGEKMHLLRNGRIICHFSRANISTSQLDWLLARGYTIALASN